MDMRSKKQGITQNVSKVGHRLVGLLVLSLVLTTGCQTYDLEDEVPEWLGSSIYDNLKNDGEYTNMVKLIEDLGYKDVLAKTGSKTLFVANDEAFKRFYSHNNWGVRSYNDLSLSQKKLLLYGAMINNSYQLNTLSSSEGPTKGDCMRRLTALSMYDSVPIIQPSEMPATKYWQRFKNANLSIVCMKDMSVTPMIHFIETQLVNNKITNEDYDFLMNYTTRREPGDASINGLPVIGKNLKASNGFIHELAEVMTPLSNMAEIIRTKPITTQYSQLLERFCAPYYSLTATRDYNRIYGTTVDSVYQKRYFSQRSQNGATLASDPDGKAVNATLKFDPGWNAYYSSTSTSTAPEKALQQDMAVMLVPSDAAMTEYWENGSGRVLKDYYGTWDAVPDHVVSKLLNNNMLNMFQSSVPSKFGTVLDDATNVMGITKTDIDSVFLGCNGAVYLTNKVFSPTAYISVSFPALVDQRMNIIYWAIEQLDYDAYLNARESYYSFFIPTNNALKYYIDPVSYGKSTTQLFKFYYDANAVQENDKVKASIWSYDVTTNSVIDSLGLANYDQIINRLEDILENHTVIGDIEDGNMYYRTKGGATLIVSDVAGGVASMRVQGSLQYDQGRNLTVQRIYNQGNGKSYILNDEPMMTTRNAVYDILQKPEFSEFFKLLNGTGLLTNLQNNHANASQNNISFLSKFHYTVYVPTNASILALQASGKLPTWEAIEVLAQTDSLAAERKTDIIRNFVKYHIQDNAVFADKNAVSGNFETAIMNNQLKVFYTLGVTAGNYAITVTDKVGNVRHVTTDTNLRNLIAREYLYDSSDRMTASKIFSSANLVVHQIDGPLMYDNNQFN